MSGGAPIAQVEARAVDEGSHATAVRAMFDRIAPTYDRLNRMLSVGVDVAWRERAVRLALEKAPPGPILDLCAGTMDLTALLARARPDERIVAADFAAQMLEAGRTRVPRAERVVADALSLPFADHEFAVVVCGFGVRNLSDPARGVREAKRVLAARRRLRGPGFLPAVVSRHARVPRGLRARGRCSPAIGGMVSGDRAAYAYLAESMKGFLSRGEYGGC